MTENSNSNTNKDKSLRLSLSEKAQLLEPVKTQLFRLSGRIQWTLVKTPILGEGTVHLGLLRCGHVSWLQMSSGICTSEILPGADIAWKLLRSSEVKLTLLKALLKHRCSRLAINIPSELGSEWRFPKW